MKKTKNLIHFKTFNKKIENPSYVFICGRRSHGKSYALKQMKDGEK